MKSELFFFQSEVPGVEIHFAVLIFDFFVDETLDLV